MGVYLFALVQLGGRVSGSRAMLAGLATGLLVFGPQLAFFWRLFGPLAISLWLILAFWLALFLVLLAWCHARWGPWVAALLAPVLWLGLEYFRSELYALRFSWLTPGFAFFASPQLPALGVLGVYGMGFVLMALAAGVSLLPWRHIAWSGPALLASVGLLVNLPAPEAGTAGSPGTPVRVAGMQLEFPAELEVPSALDELARQHPDADVLVLSEYTFDGPIPDRVKRWCRRNGKFLIAGGKELLEDGRFANTAFVVGTNGEVVFRQGKAVPIQFFQDGLPAREQRVWESPWGPIGLAVCYDLSYSRVIDRLIGAGAGALIIPTMDVADWGRRQHALHARVAPVRAAEHRVPIFRLASSGVSQLVAPRGRVTASAPFPGDRATIAGTLRLAGDASLPLDRALAPVAAGLTGLIVLASLWAWCRQSWRHRAPFHGSIPRPQTSP
jgi:apolipoprotein N-acyltransferase